MSGTRQRAWTIGLALVAAWALLVWQHYRSYPAISSDAAAPDLTAQLDAVFERSVARYRISGAAAGAFKDGNLVWSAEAGIRNAAGAPVTAETAFNVGSVSKPLAVWTTLRLAQQGVLDLDTPIRTYLKRWQFPPEAPDPDGVTLRHLLGHTAGFNVPGYGGYAADEVAPSDALALANREGGAVAQRIPAGQRRAYSGGGYVLLQLLLEDVSGQAFPRLVDEQLFTPLQMHDAGFTPEQLAQPSQAFADKSRPIESLRDVALAAAGGWLSPRDTARFIAAHWGEPAILDARWRAAAYAPTEPDASFAMSYTRQETPRGVLLGHGGNNSTWHAQIYVRPDTRDGFYFLSNATTGAQLNLDLACAWRSWALGLPARTVCSEEAGLTDGLSLANLLLGWAAIALGLWLGLALWTQRRRLTPYPQGRSALRTIGRSLTAALVLTALTVSLVMFHTDWIYWRNDVRFIDEIPLHELRLLMPALEALLLLLMLTLWSRPEATGRETDQRPA